MSIETTAIEEQALGGIQLIMESVSKNSMKVFDEIAGYQNRTIPTVFMLIKRIRMSNKLIGPYYVIGFQTPTTRHVVDVVDIIFDTGIVSLRGQGFQFEVANSGSGTVAAPSIMEAWLKMIVSGNEDLREMLRLDKEFTNGRKKTGK